MFEEQERADLRPAACEVVVRVSAFGVNRADLLQRRGLYAAPEGYPQDILGLEYAGEVLSVGKDVQRWHVGNRVMGLVPGGAYAEQVCVHEGELLAIPPHLSFEEAAAIPEVFATAHDALEQLDVQAQETVVVHAAGSGVGTAALQLLRLRNVQTIATTRTPRKLAVIKPYLLGFALCIDESWEQTIRDRTGGNGVDAIVDLVGGRYFAANQRLLKSCGRQIVIGLVAGMRAEIDLAQLLHKRLTLTGTSMRNRSLLEKREVAQSLEAKVMPSFREKKLVPVVDEIFPWSRAQQAHQRLETNQNVGKVVLRWDW